MTLYGKDSTPEICRYAVDIYAPSVPLSKKADISLISSMKARSEIAAFRARIKDKYHPSPDDADEDQTDIEYDESGAIVPQKHIIVI